MAQLNVVIGSIISSFGLILIIFQNLLRSGAGGYGNFQAEIKNSWNNIFFKKLLKTKPPIVYKGFDPKYSPSKKGVNIVGIIFILFGLFVIFYPTIYFWFN
tara:strand:- start:631 stop:933 length:303 start_codon:yes stop_codon:yes gene_type:complete